MTASRRNTFVCFLEHGLGMSRLPNLSHTSENGRRERAQSRGCCVSNSTQGNQHQSRIERNLVMYGTPRTLVVFHVILVHLRSQTSTMTLILTGQHRRLALQTWEYHNIQLKYNRGMLRSKVESRDKTSKNSRSQMRCAKML